MVLIEFTPHKVALGQKGMELIEDWHVTVPTLKNWKDNKIVRTWSRHSTTFPKIFQLCVIWVIWLNYFIVCYYHVTYEFQSKSTIYSCLNIKELFARNRCHIWSLSDCNKIQTHSNLVCKKTFSQTGQMIELCCEYSSVRFIWLYDIIMPCTNFRVNLK